MTRISVSPTICMISARWLRRGDWAHAGAARATRRQERSSAFTPLLSHTLTSLSKYSFRTFDTFGATIAEQYGWLGFLLK